MNNHTEGVVIHSLPYNDTNLIVNIFSPELGFKSYLVINAFSTRRKNSKLVYFQPLCHIEFQYYWRPSREMQKITAVHFKKLAPNLHTHPVKCCYVYLVSEILKHILVEHEANLEIYHDLISYISWLEEAQSLFFHSTIMFLIQLSHRLGFGPIDDVQDPNAPICLNILDGKFENSLSLNSKTGSYLHELAKSHFTTPVALPIPNYERQKIIELVIAFFRYHLNDQMQVNSLRIYEEIFRN